MLTNLIKGFTIFAALSLPLGASSNKVDPVSPRVHQRVPQNFRALGVDPTGRACLVIFDIYSRSGSQIRSFKGMVAPQMGVSIYSEGLAENTFQASWQIHGGRGGCPEVKVDTIRKFHFYQRTGVGAPCFANPRRLSWNAELEMQVVDSPSGLPHDALEIVINRISGVETTCTIEQAAKYFRY